PPSGRRPGDPLVGLQRAAMPPGGHHDVPGAAAATRPYRAPTGPVARPPRGPGSGQRLARRPDLPRPGTSRSNADERRPTPSSTTILRESAGFPSLGGAGLVASIPMDRAHGRPQARGAPGRWTAAMAPTSPS